MCTCTLNYCSLAYTVGYSHSVDPTDSLSSYQIAIQWKYSAYTEVFKTGDANGYYNENWEMLTLHYHGMICFNFFFPYVGSIHNVLYIIGAHNNKYNENACNTLHVTA